MVLPGLAKDWSLEHFFQKLPLAGWQKFKNSKKLYFVWCHKNAIFICWVSFAQGGSRGGGRGVNFSNFIPHGRPPSSAHQSILTFLWFMMVLFKSSSFICMPFQFRSLQHTSGILKYQKHWNIWNTEISKTLKYLKHWISVTETPETQITHLLWL